MSTGGTPQQPTINSQRNSYPSPTLCLCDPLHGVAVIFQPPDNKLPAR